jgi:hypothetical protein
MRSSILSPQEEIRLNRLKEIKNFIERFKMNNNGVLPSGMQCMLRHIDGGVTPTVSNTTGIIMWLPANSTDKLKRAYEIALSKQGNEFVYKLAAGNYALFTQRRSRAVRNAYTHICLLAAGREPIEMADMASPSKP